MKGYDYSTYGDRIAGVYEAMYEGLFEESEAAAEFLTSVASDERVLELGIGSGRIALPVAERGLRVHGIDASQAMVDRLRAQPGGADIPVTLGNFADVDVEGQFSLVFVVFNTFFGLLTQEEQVRCFQNVAGHLTESGAFVIEAFVPDPARFDRHQRVHVDRIAVDQVALSVTKHDPAEQRSRSQHVVLTEDGIKLYPVEIRYAWPSELDLMARLAGMSLRERWSGWRREPFTAESERHVSVYERSSAAYL